MDCGHACAPALVLQGVGSVCSCGRGCCVVFSPSLPLFLPSALFLESPTRSPLVLWVALLSSSVGFDVWPVLPACSPRPPPVLSSFSAPLSGPSPPLIVRTSRPLRAFSTPWPTCWASNDRAACTCKCRAMLQRASLSASRPDRHQYTAIIVW